MAVYAMRLLGVIGAEELPSEEDLAVAVTAASVESPNSKLGFAFP
jgi:hypothetical protein